MPVFRPGHLTAVAYGPINATQFLNSTDWKIKIETADTSHYGSPSKEYIPGQVEGTLSLGGMFDVNKTAGSQTLDGVNDAVGNLATDTPVTMFFDGGLAVGRRCALASAIQTNYKPSSPVGGAVSISIDAICNGRPSDGTCLVSLAPITTATTVNWASVDNAVATTAGTTLNLHAVANTWAGTTTVRLQHSTDNTTWVDLITQVVPASTNASYILTAAGTINRYVRLQAVTATGPGSVTVIAAFARN